MIPPATDMAAIFVESVQSDGVTSCHRPISFRDCAISAIGMTSIRWWAMSRSVSDGPAGSSPTNMPGSRGILSSLPRRWVADFRLVRSSGAGRFSMQVPARHFSRPLEVRPAASPDWPARSDGGGRHRLPGVGVRTGAVLCRQLVECARTHPAVDHHAGRDRPWRGDSGAGTRRCDRWSRRYLPGRRIRWLVVDPNYSHR